MENARASAQRRDQGRRNKGFEESHQEMIETAVRLISEKGVEGLSIAALARAMGINRTTVYYHFESREELLAAVRRWSGAEIAKGMDQSSPQIDRISNISHFVMENPELIKLWIDDFVSGSDIRESYPRWDELVAGVRQRFTEQRPDEAIDAEVYCALMITSAIIAPRVFRNSIEPGGDIDDIARRFIREQLRVLALEGMTK